MAAPSLGRRSWYHPLSGKIRAAALIAQSRRWIYGRVKWLFLISVMPTFCGTSEGTTLASTTAFDLGG